MHINEYEGCYSDARQKAILDYFGIEASNYNSALFGKKEDVVQSFRLTFFNISATRIKNVSVSAKSWEEVVDILVTTY